MSGRVMEVRQRNVKRGKNGKALAEEGGSGRDEISFTTCSFLREPS